MFRDYGGDSYKELSGSIFNKIGPSHGQLAIIKIAKRIKDTLEVDDWNNATEEQLSQRNEIHNKIILLCKVSEDMNKIIDIALE